MSNSDKKVVVLGASNKEKRYSYMAQEMLTEYGYTAIPVHPKIKEIQGVEVIPSLADISGEIHTLTLYVGPVLVEKLIPEIVKLNPNRVILNPGTESDELKAELDANSIPYLEACTLVMLRTNQF